MSLLFFSVGFWLWTLMLCGLRYVYFDFHHECRGMKYENISKLIETLKHDLDEMG